MPTQKPQLQSKPDLGELAPNSQNASIGYTIDPFLKILLNQDSILMQRGGGNLEIYQEVLRDDQVKSTFQQRRLAVISKPWHVEAGADDAASQACADALKANLEHIAWDNITDQQLFALFYGYSVAEIMWGVRDGLIGIDQIKVRDRSRFRFNVDGELFLQGRDYQFSAMPERKFWVLSTGADHSDNPYGLGLAHWLYWPVFFKRNDIKFWLIFLEKFGQPTALGHLPAGQENNATERQRLMAALRSVSTEAAVVLPAGAEIKLLEALRSGGADYSTMKDAMDSAIAKIVLSQTMTTDNGSSRSQSETHGNVRDMVVQADSDLLCESFNRSVVKWWFDYNQAAFAGATLPRVYRNTAPPTDLVETAKRDELIIKLGYQPTEDYIKQTYGEGWVKALPPAEGEVPSPVRGRLGRGVSKTTPPPQPSPSQGEGERNFSEALTLQLLKAQNNQDQTTLYNMAQQLAADYQGVLGDRVQQILDYAEASQDLATMQQRLTELMAEPPTVQTVQQVERATLWARLIGALTGQKA